MRTVADLKRAIAPGVVVIVTDHRYPDLNGERVVVKAQTKRFSMRLPVTHPRYEEVNDGSWLDFPPASGLRANDDGSVTIIDLCTIAIKEN